MKILQVCPIFPPQPKNFGSGVTQVVYDVSRMLVQQGHEVEVFTSNALDAERKIGNEGSSIIIDGIKVNYFPYIMHYYTFSLTPSMISTVKGRLKKFDLVHIHDFRSFQGIIVAYYARKFNIPYVIQAHGSLPSTSDSKLRSALNLVLDSACSYRLLKGASKAIALSQMEADQYKAIGIPDKKIAVIPNGIDLSEYADLPPKGSFKKKFNIPEDKRIILYLGRTHKTKGIDFLIRAYAHLINDMKYKDAVLVIAGPDDGYLQEVRSLADSLGVSTSVLFTGFISNEDKLRALVDADVFATPSFYGFPMTFLEACVTGTPIVTTNLGDTLKWMDGNVGYVASPSYYEIAGAIYAIISNERLHGKFSRNCVEIVRSKFSLEKVVARLEKVYEELFQGTSTSVAKTQLR